MKDIEIKGARRGQRKYKWEELEVGDTFITPANGIAYHLREQALDKGLGWEFTQKRLGHRKYQIKRIK